jgi:hypothetical protein
MLLPRALSLLVVVRVCARVAAAEWIGAQV